MSYFCIIANVLVGCFLSTQQAGANICTCVKHSNGSYTFTLSSPGQNCEEKNWNSQGTSLATIEKSHHTLILAKGDDFICTPYWVPKVTYTGICNGKVSDVNCTENPSDCDHMDLSPECQDNVGENAERKHWCLVAVFAVLVIIILVLIYRVQSSSQSSHQQVQFPVPAGNNRGAPEQDILTPVAPSVPLVTC